MADPLLERMVRTIVREARPRRVILFGSRARGGARPTSDYDFVVEVAFDDEVARRAVDARLRSALGAAAPDVHVDIVFRRPGQIESRCDDPGYMDWDIARDGVVMYAEAEAKAATRVRRDRVGEPRRVRPHASIADWLGRAGEDRRIVEQLLRASSDIAWSGVCFHSQQLAEKYLKVLFVPAGKRPARTHDLKRLVDLLRALGYDLPDLSDECSALNDYAVDVRYPEDSPIPTEAQGRAAWAAAQRIVGAVERAGGGLSTAAR